MDVRDATTSNNLDIGAVLNDLYANEINASIAWTKDRGFRAALDNATLAEKWFQSSGEAAGWLRYQAPMDFPQTEFAHARDRVAPRIDTVLDDLYADKISGSISWVWDDGFYAALGTPRQPDDWAFPRIDDAIEWLMEQACVRYPDSDFARKYGDFVR